MLVQLGSNFVPLGSNVTRMKVTVKVKELIICKLVIPAQCRSLSSRKL